MAQRARLIHSTNAEVLASLPLSSLKAYIAVTKPSTVGLLVFTGAVGFALASGGTFPAATFLLLLSALTLSCAGANTLTCYVDRDIDATMERTRNRPIPSLQLSPRRALIFGLALVALALVIALFLNLLTTAIIALGFINNVLVYSLWTKRKTPLNIFWGSLAGGLPAIAGYTAYANTLNLESLLLGVVVMAWIPVHVWSLALRYKADYTKVNVPMLPVVVSEKKAVQFIALASGLLVAFSLMPVALNLFGPFYLYSASILGAILFLLSLWLLLKPVEYRAWVVFKVSSVYLFLLFLSIFMDSLLHTLY